MKLVRLDKIRLDGDTQSRLSLDDDVIHEYASQMANGQEFPPLIVVFDGANYWLVDGFHRRWAAIKAKVAKFRCQVVEGTREDARWLSYGVNKDHGLPRTNEDKKKAVIAALKHPQGAKKSDRQIAEHVGVTHPMVMKYREQLSATGKDYQSPTRTGRDGRTINTTNIGKAAKPDHPTEETPLPLYDEEWEPPTVRPAPPAGVKEPTPFDKLKEYWSIASDVQKCLFRDWIEQNP